MKRFLSVALILILFQAGCVSYQQSERTRTRSFEPHAGGRIGEVEVASFLQVRTALLIADEQELSNNMSAATVTISGVNGLGCAAAVDPRGYFLTAAHCVAGGHVYLAIYDPSAGGLWPARIVWRGDWRSGGPDLAILHVETRLEHVFDVADEVLKDGPAMAVGLSLTNKPRWAMQGFQPIGGTILDSRKRDWKECDFYVATDVPLQSGDSGGPLADPEGRLIGINIKGTPPFVHYLLPRTMFPMLAAHPVRKWLHDAIEEDVAKHSVVTEVHAP